jgi:hypothetical protein
MHFRSVLLLLPLLTSRESSRGSVQAARIGAAPARHLLASAVTSTITACWRLVIRSFEHTPGLTQKSLADGALKVVNG